MTRWATGWWAAILPGLVLTLVGVVVGGGLGGELALAGLLLLGLTTVWHIESHIGPRTTP
jgi:hypothetical protein